MKRILGASLVFVFVLSFLVVPTPVRAGGNGWAIGGALLGGFLLGSILGPRDQVIVGPVYPPYHRPPVYYPPPPQPVWIPGYWGYQPVTVCDYYGRCYPATQGVWVEGHWEYR